MEQVKPPRKALFVFVFGILLWGCSMTLLVTLFDWYRTHQFDQPYKIAGRFVIFMASGLFIGHYLWNILEASGRKKPTRAESNVRLGLFVGLMLFLIYVL